MALPCPDGTQCSREPCGAGGDDIITQTAVYVSRCGSHVAGNLSGWLRVHGGVAVNIGSTKNQSCVDKHRPVCLSVVCIACVSFNQALCVCVVCRVFLFSSSPFLLFNRRRSARAFFVDIRLLCLRGYLSPTLIELTRSPSALSHITSLLLALYSMCDDFHHRQV